MSSLFPCSFSVEKRQKWLLLTGQCTAQGQQFVAQNEICSGLVSKRRILDSNSLAISLDSGKKTFFLRNENRKKNTSSVRVFSSAEKAWQHFDLSTFFSWELPELVLVLAHTLFSYWKREFSFKRTIDPEVFFVAAIVHYFRVKYVCRVIRVWQKKIPLRSGFAIWSYRKYQLLLTGCQMSQKQALD